MKQLVRLRMRPSRDGKNFAYFLDYNDESGRRRRLSLGHTDRQKAKRQQAQKERELRMGIVEPQASKLSDFVTDSLAKTGDQIRESTREEYSRTMRSFIHVVGDKDLQRLSLQDGEHYGKPALMRATVRRRWSRSSRRSSASSRRLSNAASWMRIPWPTSRCPSTRRRRSMSSPKPNASASSSQRRSLSTTEGADPWSDGTCWF